MWEKIDGINEKVEAWKEAVTSAITWLKNLMMKNANSEWEKIWKWMQGLIQRQAIKTMNNRHEAQDSIRRAFNFPQS
ncbi:MAG: hypothetical protein ACD_3C00185G0002 [uncultured bacterium (gcode 4)]|uniref:Uncharacterized protein n=1 Tax=uncultured bacterium (gcode 4) TaxID=1234023 RepID=K2G0E4_9BACT|nr:MAG: hypothetical protein ACD_3C00185G0002 [uncultured bacterium (gcode 4)]